MLEDETFLPVLFKLRRFCCFFFFHLVSEVGLLSLLAIRLEAIALRLEAIATRVEAICLACFLNFFVGHEVTHPRATWACRASRA